MNNGLLVFISPVLYNAMNEQDGVLNQFLSLFEKWSREGSTYIDSEEQLKNKQLQDGIRKVINENK